jgi:hypothetical protein
MYFTPDWERARQSVQALAELSPRTVTGTAKQCEDQRWGLRSMSSLAALTRSPYRLTGVMS